jgi:hypothetical protein
MSNLVMRIVKILKGSASAPTWWPGKAHSAIQLP